MNPFEIPTFFDRCRVKWGVRNGWSHARIALMLALPLESVCLIAASDFSGPELPIL
jgi:hypothetical protein